VLFPAFSPDATDAAARPRLYLLHRRDREPVRRRRLCCFASAKFGLRAVAHAAARELWPKNIHIAHLILDSVSTPPG
jgi:hypothetical protein